LQHSNESSDEFQSVASLQICPPNNYHKQMDRTKLPLRKNIHRLRISLHTRACTHTHACTCVPHTILCARNIRQAHAYAPMPTHKYAHTSYTSPCTDIHSTIIDAESYAFKSALHTDVTYNLVCNRCCIQDCIQQILYSTSVEYKIVYNRCHIHACIQQRSHTRLYTTNVIYKLVCYKCRIHACTHKSET